MKLDERNFLYPPEELAEQSVWDTHWIAWMYDRTQNIAVGDRKEFIFRNAIDAWASVGLAMSGKPCPALMFDTTCSDWRMPGYILSCEILKITNTHFGSVKQIETFSSTFEVLLESGRKLKVHSEEMPGALWDEKSQAYLKETQKYDWNMSVRLRILDRDPRKIFVDTPEGPWWYKPYQNDDPEEKLHKAVKEGNLTLICDLLDSGANIHSRMGKGDTPLFLAVRSENREAVELLLQRGANPNIQNHSGWGPLHTAAVQGYTELVRLLLDHGAYVDPRTKQGWTPLFLTVGCGHVDVAKLLLESNADVFAEDGEENIPLHNARKNGKQEIVKLLKNAMGLQY